MPELGYALSSEEHDPTDLARFARMAEENGFTFALISDHYHPWIEQQGHSPFVWSVLGAIAQTTRTLRIGTGVTCPTVRINPAIIAQAAATISVMMPGRFFLGVGSGEALNEHILGNHWPPARVRQDMLEEAVEVMRQLWDGDEISFYGDYYTVENARIYTLPEDPVPVYIAASGSDAAELSGRVGDGLISTKADGELVSVFQENGGEGKPTIGQITVCWASSEDAGLDTLYRWWPTAMVPGTLHADLPTPAHFEDAASMTRKEDLRGQLPIGPNVEPYLKKIQEMVDAGFEQIYIHQVGPDQEGFFRFAKQEILPRFQS